MPEDGRPDKVKQMEWFLSQPPEKQKYLLENGLLGGGGVTVNTGDYQPSNPWETKRNEYVMEDIQGMYRAGLDAQNSIADFDMGLALLEKTETGTFTESINEAKKVANALGGDFDPNEIANFEQLAPIFGKLTMERIQQTKGAVSNKEMDMFKRMNANYEYTTEGNRRLLMFGKAKAERDVKLRGLISDLRRQGKSPMEISDAVDQFVQENDLSGMLTGLVGGKQTVGRFEVEVE
jgi:hypothetical protein